MRRYSSSYSRPLLRAGLLAVSLTLGGAFSAAAQEGAAADDPVVATVDGAEIRYSDVIRSAQDLPPQYQQNLPQVFPALVQRLIDMRLMEAAGRADGLADDERVRARVAQAESQAISQVFLQKRLEEAFTDEALDAAYERWLAENPPQEEVRARHILVEEEEEARRLIAELEEGADFAALAEEHSTDPSAEGQGGDLGYFTRERMVAPFAEAAFSMEPGSHSEEPVETQFGWHVIKVEDRRQAEQPAQDAVTGQLQEMIASDVIEETRADLREGAEIELRDLSGGGAAEELPAPEAE